MRAVRESRFPRSARSSWRRASGSSKKAAEGAATARPSNAHQPGCETMSRWGWSPGERETAAEAILGTAFAGEDWVGAVRFGVTGSEVNDLALSLCQAISGHRPFVTRERAYHGMVGLARDLTVQPQWHGGLSAPSGGVRPVPRAAEVRTLPFPRTNLGDGLDYTTEAAAALLADADDPLSDA